MGTQVTGTAFWKRSGEMHVGALRVPAGEGPAVPSESGLVERATDRRSLAPRRVFVKGPRGNLYPNGLVQPQSPLFAAMTGEWSCANPERW